MIVILLIRLAIPVGRSHIISYCWTFVVAFLTGPFGLTLAVHFFGPERYQAMPILGLFFEMLKWGLGPAVVSVYISYYLDRQTSSDLPDIRQSYSAVGWKLLNCLGFATVTAFLLLPPLLTMNAEPGADWNSAKLRFVGSGTIFFIAFGLALTAQFALTRVTASASGRAVVPQTGGLQHAV
jgi:hypothetical protein